MSSGTDKDASVKYLETEIFKSVVARGDALLHILTKGLAGARELTPNIENKPSQVLEGFFKTFYTVFVLVRPLVTLSVQCTVAKQYIQMLSPWIGGYAAF
jgi:hypothetical protein